MVEIKIINNNIEIGGVKMTVEEYNRLYVSRQLPIFDKIEKLYYKFSGCQNDIPFTDKERLEELKKSKTISGKLWNDIDKAWVEYDNLRARKTSLRDKDLEEEGKNAKKLIEEKNFPIYQKAQELLPMLEQMENHWKATGNDTKKPLNDPLKDQDRGELGKRANEIEAYRKKAKQEIEDALNQDPKITNEELEVANRNWENSIWYSLLALGEKEIDNIKKRVLADIEAKRNTKKGKRKRENEEENDNSNKRPKLDNKENEDYENSKNQVASELEDDKLKSSLEVLIKMEGETDYNDKQRREELEKELWKRNRSIYLETVMEALKKRMTDAEVELDKLSEKAKRVVEETNNIIAEAREFEEFEAAKEEAIKEIGELGAKNKLTSLLSWGQTTIKAAQKNVTEKLKKDIKKIQEQIKSFKSGTNSYLSSLYQQEKSKIDRLDSDLSTYSSQTGSPKKTPRGVIISVSLVAVVIVAVAAVVIVRRRKRIEKIKK